MSGTERSPGDPDEPQAYEIRLKGHLDRRWTEWFAGLEVMLEANGETLLTGLLVDQAALHGLLRRVRDLGMPLLSVKRIEPRPGERPVNG